MPLNYYVFVENIMYTVINLLNFIILQQMKVRMIYLFLIWYSVHNVMFHLNLMIRPKYNIILKCFWFL